jgi:hypothetical protein
LKNNGVRPRVDWRRQWGYSVVNIQRGVVVGDASGEELSADIMAAIVEAGSPEDRAVLGLMKRQQDEFLLVVRLFREHLDSAPPDIRAVMRELGSVEDIRARRDVLDRMVQREARRIRVMDAFLGKFSEALASEMGKNTPRTVVAFVVVWSLGWSTVSEGYLKILEWLK